MRKSIRKFKRNGYNWLTNKKYKTIITTILLNGGINDERTNEEFSK